MTGNRQRLPCARRDPPILAAQVYLKTFPVLDMAKMETKMLRVIVLPVLVLMAACSSSGGTSPTVPAADRITQISPERGIVPDGSGLLLDQDVASPSAVTQNIVAAPAAATSGDQSFARLLNNLRIGNGLTTVSYDARLDAAAQAHADDMSRNDYFSHTGLNRSTPLARIRAAGYAPRAYGEAIAGRQPTQQDALTDWINSPPHNEILNGAEFEDFGFGTAGSGRSARWVLIMGAE